MSASGRLAIFGATGMVGAGALLAALADPRVTSVLVVSRSTTGRRHPKLREMLQPDVFALDGLRAELAAARVMAAANPRMTFCYVSGAGTDSSEQGRAMWARVKGKTENALLALPFAAAYMFRPGFIQPLDGIRSKTGWYQALYSVTAPLYPLLHRLAPGVSTTTTNLGRALVRAALEGAPARVLDSRDINGLAGGA